MVAYCPNCSTGNEFKETAYQRMVGCKACRHTWRLTALPPSSNSAAGSMLQTVSNFARAAVASVLPQTLTPPGAVQELVELEAICAVHDEPFSLLYMRQRAGLFLQRVEKGTHAIDRHCGTDEGRRRFERHGHSVHYQRTVKEIRPEESMDEFLCPWCGADDQFFCAGLKRLVCIGKSYERGGVMYGVCPPSCSHDPKGSALSTMKGNLSGRSAQIVRQEPPSQRIEQQGVKILPAPARRRLT